MKSLSQGVAHNMRRDLDQCWAMQDSSDSDNQVSPLSIEPTRKLISMFVTSNCGYSQSRAPKFKLLDNLKQDLFFLLLVLFAFLYSPVHTIYIQSSVEKRKLP